jgi:hypothetical protein
VHFLQLSGQKFLWARASKADRFHLRYTPAMAQDLALQFFLGIFSQKDQQLRHHKVIYLPLWLENRNPLFKFI